MSGSAKLVLHNKMLLNDEVLVGYDNHHPKGHHRHIGTHKLSYNFQGLEQLKNDFKADLDVELARRGLQ